MYEILGYIILFAAMVWSIHLATTIAHRANWAWGVMVFIGCCIITPLGVWFILKLLDEV